MSIKTWVIRKCLNLLINLTYITILFGFDLSLEKNTKFVFKFVLFCRLFWRILAMVFLTLNFRMSKLLAFLMCFMLLIFSEATFIGRPMPFYKLRYSNMYGLRPDAEEPLRYRMPGMQRYGRSISIAPRMERNRIHRITPDTFNCMN